MRPELQRVAPVARNALVIAILILINVGPFYRQVLHGTDKRLRGWNLFAGAATDVCSARFMQFDGTGAAGGARPLDRYALLGYGDPRKAPRRFRALKTQADVHNTGARLCRKLGQGSDVRAIYRCARRGRWESDEQTSDNLCRGPRR